MAVSALSASATTCMSGSTFKEADKPIRTMKWSSTTSMRICFGLGIEGWLCIDWNFHRNCSALVCKRVDLQIATEAVCAFAHVEQSEMSCGHACSRIEAASVIADCEPHLFRRVCERYFDILGLTVFCGISNGFLTDSKKIHLHRRRKAEGNSFHFERHSQVAGKI